jgi:hypothetical protein
MTFGVRVNNTWGDTIIDDLWLNYSLYLQGSIGVDFAGWVVSGADPTFPVTNLFFPAVVTSLKPPMLFCRHSLFDASHALAGVNLIGYPGNWTGFAIRGAGSGAKVMDYRVYAALPPSSDSFGMRVRDANGDIAFDSGRLPLIIERVIESAEWALTYNAAAGGGYREQDWETARPSQDYVSISTPLYFDGLAGVPAGRALIQIAAGTGSPGSALRHFVLYDSGSAALNPGAGSRVSILPMLCDAN